MGIGSDAAHAKAIDNELIAVLPADKRPWYQKSYLLRLNLCILSLVLFSSANGYDGSLMNGLQALDQWQTYMGSPSGAWLGFINAIYWLGVGISYPMAAWVANKFGRKPGVYIGYLLLILGVSLLAGPRGAFVASRFFVGCAAAWFGNSVPLLINEIAYPTHRGIANALFMCGWYVGGTIAGFVTFGTRNYIGDWAWRIPGVLQVLLPAVALPGFILCHESPRWLVSMNREEDARKVLTSVHGGGDPMSPLVNYEMIEITETLRAEQEAEKQSAGYAEMWKTPGNRRRLLISVTLGIFSQWSGNGVVSYYLALVLDTVGVKSVKDQTLIAGCLQIWNLIFAVAAAFSVDRVGRRPLFLASAVTMFIGYVCVTGLSGSFAQTGNAATGTAVIPFLFIFFAGYDIALTPFLTAYPCEIWPYRLRSRGLTVTWVTVTLAIFFNTFVNPIALESIGWKYYFVFIIVLILFFLTAYFFYPETRGHTLEQIAVLFDGDNARAPLPSATAERSQSIVSIALEKGQSVVTTHEDDV